MRSTHSQRNGAALFVELYMCRKLEGVARNAGTIRSVCEMTSCPTPQPVFLLDFHQKFLKIENCTSKLLKEYLALLQVHLTNVLRLAGSISPQR